MALPIVSKPSVQERSYIGPYLVYMKDRTRAVQKRPFNLVIPTTTLVSTTRASRYFGDFWGDPLQAQFYQNYFDSARFEPLENEVFPKLKGKVYGGLQLANDIIEGGQTFKMIANAAKTLLDAARSLKRGDLKSVKRLLRLKKDVKFSQQAKTFGGKWLELHFGWQPLLEEIHSGLELFLSTPPVYEKFSAKASSFTSFNDRPVDSNAWLQNRSVSASYSVKCGLIVRAVRDPVTFTLEQLGLMNPAAIAWEAVPYSFFVDYILNVGDVLASYTAFTGLDIEGMYTTRFFKLYVSIANMRKPGYDGFPSYSDLTSSLECVLMQRREGLPLPTLAVRSFKMPSKTRLATVGSLLTQFFRR